MSFNLSPRVAIFERDLVRAIQEISDSKGAAVGFSSWGAANKPILITGGETELKNRIGKPTDETYISFLTAADYLKYASKLVFLRVVGPDARNASSTSDFPVDPFPSCTPMNSEWSNPVVFDDVNFPISSFNGVGIFWYHNGAENAYADLSSGSIQDFFDQIASTGEDVQIEYEMLDPDTARFRYLGSSYSAPFGSITGEVTRTMTKSPNGAHTYDPGSIGTNGESTITLSNFFTTPAEIVDCVTPDLSPPQY